MQGVTKRLLAVVPDEHCAPEVGAALWALEETRRRTLLSLEGIPDALVDWTNAHDRHSLGTLLYHIAAIEADWLYSDTLQVEFPEDVAALFPRDVRDMDGNLTPYVGESADRHLQRLSIVRSKLMDVFRPMAAEDFQKPRIGKDYDVTPAWVIFHLTQHEAEHRAEIDSLRQRFEAEFGQNHDLIE